MASTLALSVADMLPAATELAAVIAMFGDAPPLDVMGALAVTADKPPEATLRTALLTMPVQPNAAELSLFSPTHATSRPVPVAGTHHLRVVL